MTVSQLIRILTMHPADSVVVFEQGGERTHIDRVENGTRWVGTATREVRERVTVLKAARR